MSLQLNVSNSLEDLAGQLVSALAEQETTVFQKQYLVTQTDGMNNWLTIQMATRMGISANTRFLKPNDIVNQLYFWLGGDGDKVMGAGHLQWLLFNLLTDAAFTSRYPWIASYYSDDDVKRIALAGKLADMFDQYQVYRPEMVDEWNLAAISQLQQDDWQQFIWIRVREKTGGELTDRTSVIRYIIQQLSDPVQQERLAAKLPYLHVFGVSIITQLHIHLFNQLSRFIDVSFYLLNPAPLVYWLDDKTEKQIARLAQFQKASTRQRDRMAGTGNTLLISWGKVIQETFGLLFEHEAFLNMYNDAGVTEPEPAASLLRKIQQDIFYNNDAASRLSISEEDLTDGSLTLNACYTPVREVEVLYNYLVHLADNQQGLSPRDIVVMVSDIDAYAPYIKAIFSTAAYRFPFTIADESYQSGDSLFTAIESILAISADSFKAEEVMQLLDSRYIRERFNIEDTALIRKVVGMANIRFGIAGDPEDDTVLVSWNTGLQRIMYGICMGGSTPYQTGDAIIYPVDIAEGAEALELVRFRHFVEVLKWYVTERPVKRSLAGWGAYILQLADNLVFETDTNETDEDYQRLLEYIGHLNLLTETYNEAVSYEVFKHSFLDIIHTETRSRSFAAGGITFCSLIPMRSIPFKIVALLGMNFDKFPRRETPVSFNLMEQKRRKGDRNVKDNDKHLFLETILSARDNLYISYIGRNAKDNSIHPPSALVDELVDYVEGGLMSSKVKVRELLITTQPLHGFSQKYFQQQPGLYSYLGDSLSKEEITTSFSKEAKLIDWDEIPVQALLAFFKNPFQFYYNKVLGIYYRDEEVLLPDTEIFELDKLQEWKLKNDLLVLDDAAVQEYSLHALKTGALPLKHMATIQINKTLEELAPVKELFRDCVGDRVEQSLLIDIAMGESVISGKLNGLYDDQLLVISFSKNPYRSLLDAYIKYVLVTAQGLQVRLNYISAINNEIYTIQAGTYSQATALEVLTRLVDYYKKGHAEIFLLYPGLGENPLKIADWDFFKFNKQLGGHLERNPDEYLQKEFDNGIFTDPAAVVSFIENTQDIFSPVATLFPELLPLPKNSKQKD